MKKIETVCIAGSGFMGAQIGLQCAIHGYTVWLLDISEDILRQALNQCMGELYAHLEKKRISEAELNATLSRLRPTTRMQEAVAQVDLVIESIPERLEVKRELFAQLDQHCPPHTILASNSSSLRISTIEDTVQRKDKVLNLHFFPPVWQRPMVELMRGTATSKETITTMLDFAGRIGLTPLLVQKESTGFLFNRVWRAIKKECLTLVNEGVSTHEDVDRAWMIALSSPIGPFGLMDTIGLDVVRDVEMVYYRESGDAADYPPKLLLDKISAGELGVKTGKGFYSYPEPAFQDPGWLKGESGKRARNQNRMKDFIGSWRLKSFELRSADGQISYPFGQDAKGYLLYSEDGLMSVAFMRADRPNYSSSDPMAGSPEEKAEAADTYYGYCGSFEVQEDTVIHHIEVSFFPNWGSTDQVRLYRFEGGQLTLSTPPFLVSGTQQSAHLVWERAG